ncbi:hypothetical protein Gohar_016703, partial [Gossypium harknessii]|nr:hypothetical protein [Gossypium harknessii]
MKKKWFLPEKRRTKEWEVKIEQGVDIKRFVQNNGGRVIGIVESIKRERVRGRVKEDIDEILATASPLWGFLLLYRRNQSLKVGLRSFEGNGDMP